MKDMLYGLLALIGVVAAGFFFYTYVSQGDKAESVLPLVGVVVCALIAIGFGALFLSGRVNKTEDIHITE